MIERVATTIERYGMTARGRRLGVAVSGGADSVFLLHALRELGLASAVLHVNHKLRGEESDRDEDFVAKIARKLQLPVYTKSVQTSTGNMEQETRHVRYGFFAEQIAVGVCDSVATGHTLDDQAETVLLRFLRGAGTAGLSGIRPVMESGIVRPLIELRREDIRHWLRERNTDWREDNSNLNTDFARNMLRLQTLPQLEADFNPSLARVLSSTATWARDEEVYWAGELDRLESRHLIRKRETVLIRIRPFRELPVAVQRRLLRRGAAAVRGDLRSIDFEHIEAIRVLMESREGSGRVQLPRLDVYRSFDWLRLAPIGIDSRLERNWEVPLGIPGRTEVPDRSLLIEVELVSASRVYNDEVNGVDRERCAGRLLLRNWRPGDQYRAKGRSVSEKIKMLFQEYRVPLWERRNWPVLERNGEIVWARGFGVAAKFASDEGTRMILVVRELMNSRDAGPGTFPDSESSSPVRTSIEVSASQDETQVWHPSPAAGR